MKQLSEEEKRTILNRLFWDEDVDIVQLDRILKKTVGDSIDPKERILFRRLLMSCDWYTLLKLLSQEKLKSILSDSILDTIFPKDLQDRYRYVRNVLHR